MSVSAADAVRHLSQRLSARSELDRAAEAAALRLVPTLVARLREAGATRVVLFGSLAGGFFRTGSDIDLAVSGVSESSLARLEHQLTLISGRPVELANLDTASPALRDAVHRSGRDYE